jgi:O-methyltransferase involved in polyketide biosynthesis
VIYVPVDFEQENALVALERAGFASADQAFFSWLGVVPYLTEDAVDATFRLLASLKADVVFDYANPPESYSPEQRAAHDERAARVAAVGESWRTYFDTSTLHTRLETLGFEIVEDYGPPEIAARIFKMNAPMPDRNGGHLLHARVRRSGS